MGKPWCVKHIEGITYGCLLNWFRTVSTCWGRTFFLSQVYVRLAKCAEDCSHRHPRLEYLGNLVCIAFCCWITDSLRRYSGTFCEKTFWRSTTCIHLELFSAWCSMRIDRYKLLPHYKHFFINYDEKMQFPIKGRKIIGFLIKRFCVALGIHRLITRCCSYSMEAFQ